jgi:hypothetical protein
VLLSFWRGRRLGDIEPRVKPGGKYERATLEIREGVTVKPAIVSRLAREAVALNQNMGDPTKVLKARLKSGGLRSAQAKPARRSRSDRISMPRP